MSVKVGIVIGSDSDFDVMVKACDILKSFDVEFEMLVASAHRTPDVALDYAKNAEDKGLEVIIAGAGLAAHLPGVLAAKTILPVIGVPISSKNLKGVDALYSIVQMPKGIPVATVAIDGSQNAGILAVQILARSDENLKNKLRDYSIRLKEEVLIRNQKVQEKLAHLSLT